MGCQGTQLTSSNMIKLIPSEIKKQIRYRNKLYLPHQATPPQENGVKSFWYIVVS